MLTDQIVNRHESENRPLTHYKREQILVWQDASVGDLFDPLALCNSFARYFFQACDLDFTETNIVRWVERVKQETSL
jgi:hypothetical protein